MTQDWSETMWRKWAIDCAVACNAESYNIVWAAEQILAFVLQAIEAGTDKTEGLGPQGESAVGNADAAGE